MEVHRCRFVPYPASAINALAFSHPSPSAHEKELPETLRLAIGRANGDIEIWNPLRGSWFQETILAGGRDRSIEGLCWTQDPDEEDDEGRRRPGKLRLFSIGYSTWVTEWDLVRGTPARHSDGNYGEIWCLAAQPRLPSEDHAAHGKVTSNALLDAPRAQDLVVGCADGAVVLLSTEDGDLRFRKLLARPAAKKARVLSVAFRNRTVVLAGCADSTIRVLDARTGQVIRNMSLGAGPVDGPRDILVWSVKTLPNGDVVSGDSTGEVRFWDGRTYSLLQRLKSHKADILDLEVSADGQTVVSCGMDRRTTFYQRTGGKEQSKRVTWGTVAHTRLHSHDVKTMAAFDSKSLSVIASGGLDTTPIIIPLRAFGKETHRTISSLPQHPHIQSAPRRKLLLGWWNREAWIWRFHDRPASTKSGDGEPDAAGAPAPKLVARILIKGDENICSASLSACGNLVAISTTSEVKLFQLRQPKSETGKGLRVLKVQMPGWASQFAGRLVLFSPDTRWLGMVNQESTVHLARITKDSQSSGRFMALARPVPLRRLARDARMRNDALPTGLGGYDRTINRAAFSADGRILVVGDLGGHLDSWVLVGQEDVTQTDESPETADDSASSSSEEDEAAESHARRGGVGILGQYWMQNPSASLVPTLPSAALIISFRPSNTLQPSRSLNSTEVTHPLSHDLPVVDDRVLIITAQHQVYEFHLLKGTLTPWSRRNPTSSFPAEFRRLRDRAIGCFWDIDADRERAWIYGSTWLGMFDLSCDFPASHGLPAPGKHRSRKRKRGSAKHDEQDHDRAPPPSGTDSKISESERLIAPGRRMLKFTGPNRDDAVVVDLDPDPTRDEDEGTLEDASQELELARSRRLLTETAGPAPEDGIPHDGGAAEMTTADGRKAAAAHTAPQASASASFWCTRRYEPILGVVAINERDSASRPDPSTPRGRHHHHHQQQQKGTARPLEVAVVERPLVLLPLDEDSS